MTLVDSNVLIDVMTDDPIWCEWSIAKLRQAAGDGPLVINDVIYAETSVGYPSSESAEAALERLRVQLVSLPRAALFLAGRAFVQYRRAGGPRTGVLSDFFIGAHAEVKRSPLLTRDARRYRHCFPTVELITPDVN
ncbi:MAG: type II toxin-antitoxin system VapC family toxin [Tardiphaga sp.]|nr:type II toxin-antitoxin system VapC family toxin [Tardiphaga sp.]